MSKLNKRFLASVKANNAKLLAKKNKAHQAGDVLEDGSIVADPFNAVLELHDQANPLPPKPEAAYRVDLVQTLPWPTPPERVIRSPTLAELAAPFGSNNREREVVKKRFRNMHGKLASWPEGERRAFLQWIQHLDA